MLAFSALVIFCVCGLSSDTRQKHVEANTKHLRISVCIPAIYADIVHPNVQRFTTTLKSIDEQQVQPYEVIVAVSEATNAQARQRERYFQRLLHQTKLIVIASRQRGSVGMNRNRAASHAKGEILTFFDADADVMHPQRLQLIQWGFLTFPVDLVLHSFSAETEAIPINVPPELDRVIGSTTLCVINAQRTGHEWLLAEVHHGHLSITSTLFRKHAFTTDYMGYEDSKFVNTVIGNSSCGDDRAGVFLNHTLTLGYLARSQKSSQN